MRKSQAALVASIVVFLLYWAGFSLGSAFSVTFSFLPGASIILLIMSFYLKLNTLDKRQVDKSLWSTMNWLKLPRFLFIVSIFLFVLNYEFLLSERFSMYFVGSVFLEFVALFLAMVSVFLKFNVFRSGTTKSFVVLTTAVAVFLTYLLLFLLAQRVAYLPELVIIPEVSMLLLTMSFYLKLDELDKGAVGDTFLATIVRLWIPPSIAVVAVVLFALDYVIFAFFTIEVGGGFGFLAFLAIFLGIISVFLKLNVVDGGKLIGQL